MSEVGLLQLSLLVVDAEYWLADQLVGKSLAGLNRTRVAMPMKAVATLEGEWLAIPHAPASALVPRNGLDFCQLQVVVAARCY